jgi:hypothetical protein
VVIRRLGVLSLAKVLGLLYAVIGLIAGAILSLVALAASAIGGRTGFGLLENVFFGAGAIVVLPILYGAIGVVGGLIVGFAYNVIAGAVGGIELELAEQRPPGGPAT